MSTLTTVQTATMPRVNLLPPEIADDRRFRRLQGLLGIVVVVALALIVVGFLSAAATVGKAEDELAVAQSTQTELNREVARYRDVPLVYAQVAKAETQLTTAMGAEVRWSDHLRDFKARLPREVAVSRIVVVQGGVTPAVTTVQGVDTGGAVIGNISFSGLAPYSSAKPTHNAVAAWLDSMAKQKRYANPYFTISQLQTDDPLVKFEASVDVNEQSLSRRYLPGKGQ